MEPKETTIKARQTSDPEVLEEEYVTSREGGSLSRGSEAVDMEELFQALGTRGRYQVLQMVLQMVSSFVIVFPTMAIVFIGYQPAYQCRELDNATQLQPYFSDNSDVSNVTIIAAEYNQCSVDVTFNLTVNGTMKVLSLPCPAGIKFSIPADTSLLTEWSLVCDKSWLTELSQTVIMAGMAVGGVLFSSLSDCYGRKKVYMCSSFGVLLASSLISSAHDYYIFLLWRILTGFFAMGIEVSAYTMFMELLPLRQRWMSSVVDASLWSAGGVVMAALAYLMQDISWRYLNLAFSAVFVYSLILPCFLDESLRWLQATGNTREMEKIIRKACRMNGKHFKDIQKVLNTEPDLQDSAVEHEAFLKNNDVTTEMDDVSALEVGYTSSEQAGCVKNGSSVNGVEMFGQFQKESSRENYTVLDLCRHRVVLAPFLVVTFVWCTNSLYYYCVMLGSARLHGNRFLNFGILIILEIPAMILGLILIPRFNRKTLATFYGLSESLFLLLSVVTMQLVTNEVGPIVSKVAQYAGKFSNVGSSSLLFVYCLEVFPTKMRSTGMGVAGAVVSVTNTSVPFIVFLGESVPWAPRVLISSLCILATLSIRLLPETRDRKLPDTITEMKTWSNKTKTEQTLMDEKGECETYKEEETCTYTGAGEN